MNQGARSAVKTAIVVAVLAFNVFYYARSFGARKNGIDFPAFYSAARMVLSGNASRLYDVTAQQQYQAQYTGRIGVLFNHPPFEALLYLPAALLSYAKGYFLWTVVTTCLTATAMFLMNRAAEIFSDSGLLIMLAFVFAPVTLDLLQGQDAAVLLLIYAIFYSRLRRDDFFWAGGVLALGLIKPHLVLPCFLIIAIARRSGKFVAGFAVGAAGLALVSLAVFGPRVFEAYPRFILNSAQLGIPGYATPAMANLRGLLSLVLANSWWRAAVLIPGSIMLIWIAVRSWSRFNELCSPVFEAAGPPQAPSKAAFDLAFSNAIVVTLLVSYHLSPHDATLLLIPIVLGLGYLRQRGLGRDPLKIFLAVLLVGLFLPPLHVLVLGIKTYALVAIPLLLFSGCLMAAATEGKGGSSERVNAAPTHT